jgi:hydroxymethylpyrimidine/phosphomethylpyrimidine kinase
MSQATSGHAPIALTIAGSDSSGGAGIQADLKTFTALGVYGASVITALTAQNTRGVQAVEVIRPAFVLQQIDAVLSDLDVGAIKTGMLATAQIVSAVAARLRPAACPLVVDPVMVATSGDMLLAADAVGSIIRDLAPLATVITPTMPEAARLLGIAEARSEPEAIGQAQALLRMLGSQAVLLKGGHGEGHVAIDYLCDHTGIERFARPRIDTPHTHGTGCVLSAAIAALLAQGAGLREAIGRSKDFVWQGLQSSAALRVGQGRGPVDPLFAIRSAPPPV